MDRSDGKLVVIGLDGGTFNAIDPLIEENKLPNIERIIKEGVRGNLLSTIPPVTGPAWASFMTGKSPQSHGLYDFVKPLPNDYKRQIVSYKDIRSKTIWSILSEYGKKLGVINVPVTYPPPEVNGFLISGMLTPSIESQFTYPISLSNELQSKYGEYILDIWWQKYGRNRVKNFIQDLTNCTVQRQKITLDLMGSKEWDFFMTVFSGTDRIQHSLWQYLFPENRNSLSKKEKQVRELIIFYYQQIDKSIGEIFNFINSRANLLIMSDHGFGPLRGKFYLNKWLEEIGLLSYDKRKIKKFRLKSSIIPALRQIIRVADPLNVRNKIISKMSNNSGRMSPYNFLDCIDWSKTKAYAASNTEQGLYINLAGREPQGIVKPGRDSNEVREKIIKELKNLVDPEKKERFVSEVYKKEEIYSGPFVNRAPDIIFFLKGGQYIADVQPRNYLFEELSWKTGTGTHRMEGIFIAFGEGIKKGIRIKRARIIDLAPTILNMMNTPIPIDMDGKVLEEIFTDEYIKDHPSQYAEETENDFTGNEENYLPSQEEAELVEEKLQDLGYL
jgi:predicted AlkP superfamily phosphohydrolase/phosphomutase